MPHNHTAPTPEARERAATELRERAHALRELAAQVIERGAGTPAAAQLGEAVDNGAAELEAVADWLAQPYGTCDECGEKLHHFTSENVGGVVCPDCDHEFVEEVAGSEPTRPNALCSDCGRPMMFDHSVCFSDDCVRRRWEEASR